MSRSALWLDDLVAEAPPGNAAAVRRRETADRELLDLLARDPYVPRVTAAIRARLAPTTRVPRRPPGCNRYWIGRSRRS